MKTHEDLICFQFGWEKEKIPGLNGLLGLLATKTVVVVFRRGQESAKVKMRIVKVCVFLIENLFSPNLKH